MVNDLCLNKKKITRWLEDMNFILLFKVALTYRFVDFVVFVL